MANVSQVISECFDDALSTSNLIDKETFYDFIEQRHQITKETVGENLEVVHNVLKQILGSKHYRVEQLTITTLHERTKRGIYTKNNEIAAFDKLLGIFIKDAEESIRSVREHDFQEMTSYIANLEKSVKDVQAKLREAERLAIMGQTAAMVGHDIRNPLQAITGDLYLLRDEVKNVTDDETRKSMLESIEAIEENTLYINKIVSDLQDYTRQLKPNIRDFNLKDLLSSVLLTVKIPLHVTTEVTVDSNLTMKSDVNFLRRVLTNLVLNATQAMEKGGKLTIAAYLSTNKVVITIKDSGAGIPEEVKKNMFTPFYTTKSKGQGLGLPVVKRLVEALNGTVKVESEKDNGAQFIVELPG